MPDFSTTFENPISLMVVAQSSLFLECKQGIQWCLPKIYNFRDFDILDLKFDVLFKAKIFFRAN